MVSGLRCFAGWVLTGGLSTRAVGLPALPSTVDRCILTGIKEQSWHSSSPAPESIVPDHPSSGVMQGQQPQLGASHSFSIHSRGQVQQQH